jgi:hypothetical protein
LGRPNKKKEKEKEKEKDLFIPQHLSLKRAKNDAA